MKIPEHALEAARQAVINESQLWNSQPVLNPLEVAAKTIAACEAAMWQSMDKWVDDDGEKLIQFANNHVCITSSIAKGPIEVTADFDVGFTPVRFRPLPTPPEEKT